MRRCPHCEQTKELTEFAKNSTKKDGLASWCRECQKQASKRHYEANKSQRIKDSHDRSVIYRRKIDEYLDSLNMSCVCCGENARECLDFHHVDPSTKEFSISYMKNKFASVDRLKGEISKCVVVCSNCHRKIHAGTLELKHRGFEPLSDG